MIPTIASQSRQVPLQIVRILRVYILFTFVIFASWICAIIYFLSMIIQFYLCNISYGNACHCKSKIYQFVINKELFRQCEVKLQNKSVQAKRNEKKQNHGVYLRSEIRQICHGAKIASTTSSATKLLQLGL